MILDEDVRLTHICEHVELSENVRCLLFQTFYVFISGQVRPWIILKIMSYKTVFDKMLVLLISISLSNCARAAVSY